jgi:hypothetical protein
MKKLLKEIPIITKYLLSIAIIIYVINIITSFFEIKLNNYLGLYHYTNEHFNIFQIFTFSFSHDQNPTHLLYNILYILLIGSECEKILKLQFVKLITLTIIINIIGIQLIPIELNYIGLSTIGFSLMTCFFLLKNNLNVVLSFSLKLMIILLSFNELVLFFKNFSNGIFDFDFHTSYAHILGMISGLIFFIYFKIKKGMI